MTSTRVHMNESFTSDHSYVNTRSTLNVCIRQQTYLLASIVNAIATRWREIDKQIQFIAQLNSPSIYIDVQVVNIISMYRNAIYNAR